MEKEVKPPSGGPTGQDLGQEASPWLLQGVWGSSSTEAAPGCSEQLLGGSQGLTKCRLPNSSFSGDSGCIGRSDACLTSRAALLGHRARGNVHSNVKIQA